MGQASRGCTRTHGIARLASRFMRVAAAHKLLRQNQRAASPVVAPVEAPRAPLLARSPAAGSRKRLRRVRAVTLGTFAVAAICAALEPSSSHAQALPSETSGNPNEVLAFGQMRVPRWLAETVVRAAQVTGVDPAYLMALADKESSLLPDSKAQTSSAQGLFQFVEGTWLEVLHRYGPKHGYKAEAEAIQIVAGRPVVPDAKDHKRILSLRCVPYLAALMAGEMINTHRQVLAGTVARHPSLTELYLAHFLGVQGASRFVALLSNRPGRSAPTAFPQAARANRPLFFASVPSPARRRTPMTIAEVHGCLGAMIDMRVARYASVRQDLSPGLASTSD
jgi:hypothetical protein